jgi:adiponectin receptor
MANLRLSYKCRHLPSLEHPLPSVLSHVQQYFILKVETYTITNRFDYAGINLLIAGSAFPPLYYSMYCQIAVAIVYLSISFVIAVFCFIVCLFEWIHRPGHEKYKAFLFGGYGVSMMIPISHLIINEVIYDNYGDPYIFSVSLPYYLLLGVSYLSGLYIYTVRCPERYNPGKYNVCGHSHQIWHGMVVLGILFTFLGSLENF